MLPSSTVENYLKAIYQGASTLTPPQRLLPMGQLLEHMGLTPQHVVARFLVGARANLRR